MIPIPKTELVVEEDGGGATLISYHQGFCKAVTLNSTGYSVWKMINGNNTFQKIASQITMSFSTSPTTNSQSVVKEVEDFVVALEKEGFVDLVFQKVEEWPDEQKC